jgi:hypothetical protein
MKINKILISFLIFFLISHHLVYGQLAKERKYKWEKGFIADNYCILFNKTAAANYDSIYYTPSGTNEPLPNVSINGNENDEEMKYYIGGWFQRDENFLRSYNGFSMATQGRLWVKRNLYLAKINIPKLDIPNIEAQLGVTVNSNSYIGPWVLGHLGMNLANASHCAASQGVDGTTSYSGIAHRIYAGTNLDTISPALPNSNGWPDDHYPTIDPNTEKRPYFFSAWDPLPTDPAVYTPSRRNWAASHAFSIAQSDHGRRLIFNYFRKSPAATNPSIATFYNVNYGWEKWGFIALCVDSIVKAYLESGTYLNSVNIGGTIPFANYEYKDYSFSGELTGSNATTDQNNYLNTPPHWYYYLGYSLNVKGAIGLLSPDSTVWLRYSGNEEYGLRYVTDLTNPEKEGLSIFTQNNTDNNHIVFYSSKLLFQETNAENLAKAPVMRVTRTSILKNMTMIAGKLFTGSQYGYEHPATLIDGRAEFNKDVSVGLYIRQKNIYGNAADCGNRLFFFGTNNSNSYEPCFIQRGSPPGSYNTMTQSHGMVYFVIGGARNHYNELRISGSWNSRSPGVDYITGACQDFHKHRYICPEESYVFTEHKGEEGYYYYAKKFWFFGWHTLWSNQAGPFNLHDHFHQDIIATDGPGDMGTVGDELAYLRDQVEIYSNYKFQYVFTTNGHIGPHSDLKLKKNIIPFTSVLHKLLKIRGVRFYWKTAREVQLGLTLNKLVIFCQRFKHFMQTGHNNFFHHQSQKEQVGFIAQEIEPYFPHLVHTDPKGKKYVKIEGLVPILIEAIKERQTNLNDISSEISQLKTQINILKGSNET